METFSKEYGWLPSQIENEEYKNIMAYWDILQIKRKIEQIEIKKHKKR